MLQAKPGTPEYATAQKELAQMELDEQVSATMCTWAIAGHRSMAHPRLSPLVSRRRVSAGCQYVTFYPLDQKYVSLYPNKNADDPKMLHKYVSRVLCRCRRRPA